MSKTKKDIFNQIVLVNVSNPIWSGYKRTTEGDLAKMNATLPGDGIITKGGKKIFPVDAFTPFNTLKKEISRKLISVGVSALGGSARVIPVDKAKEIQNFLDESKQKFDELLNDFESSYDEKLESHLSAIKEPVVREIVTNSALTKEQAISRFGFYTDVFKIVPKGDGIGLVNNLASKLFSEVATSARDAYEKSFLGKPRVGQRALNQVLAIRNKMAGLSMLDGNNIQPIVDSIDKVLNDMPKDGWIEGVHYSALIGLVSMLCDPEDMLKHSETIQKGIASSVQVDNQVVNNMPIQPQLSLVDPVEVEDTKTEVVVEKPLPIVDEIKLPKVQKVAHFF